MTYLVSTTRTLYSFLPPPVFCIALFVSCPLFSKKGGTHTKAKLTNVRLVDALVYDVDPQQRNIRRVPQRAPFPLKLLGFAMGVTLIARRPLGALGQKFGTSFRFNLVGIGRRFRKLLVLGRIRCL